MEVAGEGGKAATDARADAAVNEKRRSELVRGFLSTASTGYSGNTRRRVLPIEEIFSDSSVKRPSSDELAPLTRLSRPASPRINELSLLDGASPPPLKRPSEEATDRLTGASVERLAHVATTTKHKLFSEMPLPTWLIGALADMNIVQPTPVQQRLIDAILEAGNEGSTKRFKSVLVKGQTGTGKSLGYIIALLARMHREREMRTLEMNITSCYHLVLVPSDILAQQLLRWIKLLVQNNAYLLGNLERIVNVLTRDSPADIDDEEGEQGRSKGRTSGFSHILLATPTMVRSLLAKGQLNVAALRTVVADEGDALLKPLSQYATAKEKRNRLKHPVPAMTLLKEIQNICAERGTATPQLVLSSASLSFRCREELRGEGLIEPTTTLFIRDGNQPLGCPPSITHHYRMLANAQSIEELMQLIHWIWTRRTGELGVLFVPAARSKTSMQGWLETVGIRSLILSELPTGDHVALRKALSEHDDPPLLLGSDVDARGWDLPDVRYVIVVDLPESPTHYLHMAGRVGRMGAPGTVYTFVAGASDMERLTNLYSLLRLSPTPYIPED